MPLIVLKNGQVHYVQDREVLSEILGHTNFDGEDWSIGDRLIFEDGTESQIMQEPGDPGYCWKRPETLADFEEVRRLVGSPEVTDWAQLFAAFEAQSNRSGCLPALFVFVWAFFCLAPVLSLLHELC